MQKCSLPNYLWIGLVLEGKLKSHIPLFRHTKKYLGITALIKASDNFVASLWNKGHLYWNLIEMSLTLCLGVNIYPNLCNFGWELWWRFFWLFHTLFLDSKPKWLQTQIFTKLTTVIYCNNNNNNNINIISMESVAKNKGSCYQWFLWFPDITDCGSCLFHFAAEMTGTYY